MERHARAHAHVSPVTVTVLWILIAEAAGQLAALIVNTIALAHGLRLWAQVGTALRVHQLHRLAARVKTAVLRTALFVARAVSM